MGTVASDVRGARSNATNLVDCLGCLERRCERRPVGRLNRGTPGRTLVRCLLVRGLGRLVCAPNRSLRPARPRVERHPAHERQRPRPGAGARRRARAFGTALVAARDSRSRKGQLRDHRRADHRRLGDHRRSLAEERCHASREAQGRRRDHPRQDDHARIRVRLDDSRLRLRHDEKTLTVPTVTREVRAAARVPASPPTSAPRAWAATPAARSACRPHTTT